MVALTDSHTTVAACLTSSGRAHRTQQTIADSAVMCVWRHSSEKLQTGTEYRSNE
jgi:hypothetical protein